ncbi:hypothetical protein DFJ77DRAFT_121756 [Powellomyces hirtus]|nr:hypothetical protein DFJ77DRAFT_121756 [Powellomyces hirtus]
MFLRTEFSSTACVYSSTNNDGRLRVRMEFPDELGWVAFGIGSGMSNADVMLAYPTANGTSANVQQRTASGYRLPALNPTQDVEIVASETGRFNFQGKPGLAVTFLRPVASSTAGVPTIEATGQRVMYAGLVGGAPTSPTNIRKHTSFGVTTANLVDGSMRFAPSDGTPPPVLGGSGGDTEALTKVHGIVMFIAWVIIAPLAIMVARFMKATLGVWWFRVHLGLFLFGTTILTYVGLGLIYHVVNVNGKKHYNYEANGIHAILGLIVIILTFPQVVLGFVIDKLWKPTREAIPWWDKVHWWLGRLVFLIALINLPFGIALFYKYRESQESWPYIVYGILLGAAIAGFAFLQVKNGRTPKEKVKGTAATHASSVEMQGTA